jgi:hypothetical protein
MNYPIVYAPRELKVRVFPGSCSARHVRVTSMIETSNSLSVEMVPEASSDVWGQCEDLREKRIERQCLFLAGDCPWCSLT